MEDRRRDGANRVPTEERRDRPSRFFSLDETIYKLGFGRRIHGRDTIGLGGYSALMYRAHTTYE
jgi:hypothetical protein